MSHCFRCGSRETNFMALWEQPRGSPCSKRQSTCAEKIDRRVPRLNPPKSDPERNRCPTVDTNRGRVPLPSSETETQAVGIGVDRQAPEVFLFRRARFTPLLLVEGVDVRNGEPRWQCPAGRASPIPKCAVFSSLNVLSATPFADMAPGSDRLATVQNQPYAEELLTSLPRSGP